MNHGPHPDPSRKREGTDCTGIVLAKVERQCGNVRVTSIIAAIFVLALAYRVLSVYESGRRMCCEA